MKVLSTLLRFHTPAFLGDAEQNGTWRTPPIKALLRQFWRMDYARRCGFQVSIDAMRRDEAALFGSAADAGDSNQSQVRIRLNDWSQGKLKAVPAIGTVSIGSNRLPAALYSGYGPVEKGPKLKANAAIQSGEETTLRVAFPEGQGIEQALALMHSYGTLGGRSRNGWGSFELTGDLPEALIPQQPWEEAMQSNWPHAIGTDERGALIWESNPQDKWEDAMRLLAQTRADVRRAVPDRLMLAYPDTKGVMPGWSKDYRVPNSLRFKVRSAGKQFVAVGFHMPCRPSDALWNKLTPAKQRSFIPCFSSAHAFLDRHPQFKRAGA